MVFAQVILWTVAIYSAVGVVFAAVFLARGAGAIDPAARGAPVGFRVLIFPGCAALWPLLARRWLGVRGGRPETPP